MWGILYGGMDSIKRKIEDLMTKLLHAKDAHSTIRSVIFIKEVVAPIIEAFNRNHLN